MTGDVMAYMIEQSPKVRRLPGDGAMICCPAHDDRTPSLSVSRGERGILLNCFAGCRMEDVCAAFGVTVRDLFYDATRFPHRRIGPTTPRPSTLPSRRQLFDLLDYADDLAMRADDVCHLARDISIEQWTESQLDTALACVGQAYADQERARLIENVVNGFRQRAIQHI